jgi:hypothetical protein
MNGDTCTFFCGGNLSSDTYTKTNQQTTGSGANRATYTYTYTYNKVVGGSVDPQSCYNCSATTSGGVDAQFCGFIAGESFVLKNNGPWTKKYSFTLKDDLGLSRVINVYATLQRSDDGGSTWSDVQGPSLVDTSTIVSCGKPTDSEDGTFCDGLGPVVDYLYSGNGGTFGDATAKLQLHPPLAAALTNDIMNGVSPSQDNFTGNNNDLCSSSQTAPFFVSFPGITTEGLYRVHMTGTIKGNGGFTDVQFNVDSNDTFSVNRCGAAHLECDIPSCPTPTPTPEPIP